MIKRSCPVVCAALRRKYVSKFPAEYRCAFVRDYGFDEGMKRWRAFQAAMESDAPVVSCKAMKEWSEKLKE